MAEDGENLVLEHRRPEQGSSASLPAIPGSPRRGSGRSHSARMKKSVFYVLLAAAFAVAALVGLTSGASAEQRTVTVRLADGSLTTVTVDVPPGTPLEDIQLPPPPELPTTPVPIPDIPGVTPPPPDDGGGNSDGSNPSDQTDAGPNASDK